MELDNNLIIRKARIEDAETLTSLTEELGYHTTVNEIIRKIKNISTLDDQQVFVAEYDKVIGWMHISLVEPFESTAFVEIRGIVVNEEYRGKGVGTRLIKTAADWARTKECNKIRIRTNVNRTETREYYRKIGFISKKTQEVFEKDI